MNRLSTLYRRVPLRRIYAGGVTVIAATLLAGWATREDYFDYMLWRYRQVRWIEPDGFYQYYYLVSMAAGSALAVALVCMVWSRRYRWGLFGAFVVSLGVAVVEFFETLASWQTSRPQICHPVSLSSGDWLPGLVSGEPCMIVWHRALFLPEASFLEMMLALTPFALILCWLIARYARARQTSAKPA